MSLLGQLQRVGTFLETLEGIATLLPIASVIADALFPYLPLAPHSRILFFLGALISITFAYLWTVGHYWEVTLASPKFRSMGRVALIWFVIAALLTVGYFVIVGFAENAVRLSKTEIDVYGYLLAALAAAAVGATAQALIVAAMRKHVRSRSG